MASRVLGAALCASALLPAHALYEDLAIENDERRAFHVDSFGFLEGGQTRVVVNDFVLMVPENYESPGDEDFRIAFVLQRSNSDSAVRLDELGDLCFHENLLNEDDTVISLASRHSWGQLKFKKTIQTPGYYHLYFSNCEANTQATFELQFTNFNLNSDGDKVYLSAGLQSLPTWYFFMFAVFCGLAIAWAGQIKKDLANTRSIHWLMSIVLLLKICTLFFEAVKYHVLKSTGENDGWAVIYYIFTFVKGMMMFGVIVLIGTGWGHLKPFLTERDKQIMLGVLVAQGMVNIALVVVDEGSPGSQTWLTWRDILHLVDMLCCCAILLPIVWSIRHLRQASESDGKAARNMQRLKNFKTFYLLVVCYVYFTRIIVYLMSATLSYDLAWMAPVFAEVAAVVFYGTTGYLFRPQPRNPYLAIGKDDDDAPRGGEEELEML